MVERRLPKADVAGSSPVSRSICGLYSPNRERRDGRAVSIEKLGKLNFRIALSNDDERLTAVSTVSLWFYRTKRNKRTDF